jgi:hypothetical protein
MRLRALRVCLWSYFLPASLEIYNSFNVFPWLTIVRSALYSLITSLSIRLNPRMCFFCFFCAILLTTLFYAAPTVPHGRLAPRLAKWGGEVWLGRPSASLPLNAVNQWGRGRLDEYCTVSHTEIRTGCLGISLIHEK